MHSVTLLLSDDLYRFYDAIAEYQKIPLSDALQTALMQQLLSICARSAAGEDNGVYPPEMEKMLSRPGNRLRRENRE